MKNLCRALVLTCDDTAKIRAKASGRIKTTLAKAKEVRPFVEKMVTTAVKAMKARDEAAKLASSHARGSDEYKTWRASEAGQAWLAAQAKYIHRRRQLFDALRSNQAVTLLINKVAPRFVDRPGGYTRVVRIAKPRLADAAPMAYLEFVSEATRLAVDKSS
jgi:large subunit ribosomal protein L17